MGDMADMALSETLDMEDLRFEYRMGGMSDQVAYQLGVIDERGGYHHVPMFSRTPRSMTCRYCGAPGLSWVSTPTGWRLGASGAVHSCGAYQRRQPSADDFAPI